MLAGHLALPSARLWAGGMWLGYTQRDSITDVAGATGGASAVTGRLSGIGQTRALLERDAMSDHGRSLCERWQTVLVFWRGEVSVNDPLKDAVSPKTDGRSF